MGYRENWFNNAIPFMGKYKCQHCGEWFPKSQIDVDHIIPKKYGGTDDLYNLQGLCKHCNRSKQADLDKTVPDLAKNAIKLGAKNVLKNVLK